MFLSIKAVLIHVAFGLLLMVHTVTARATVVMELTLEELVAQSALIFTGTVLGVDVDVDDELVYSTVTFALATTIKGQAPESPTDWTLAPGEGTVEGHPSAAPGHTLQLRFLGGQADGLSVEVAGQQIPQAGDRGLFFISDPRDHQVNPLTGWSQGWFPLFDSADGTAWLNLRQHQNYALTLGLPNPLAQKMQALGFSAEDIETRVPGSFEFPLADFAAAIAHIVEMQGD